MAIFRVSIAKKKYYKGDDYYRVTAVVSRVGGAKLKQSMFKNGDKVTYSSTCKYYHWYFSTRLQASNAVKRLKKYKV